MRMNILQSFTNSREQWVRNRLIKIPSLSFRWRHLDFRAWYYVWIDGKPCDWWAHKYELDDLRKRYGKNIILRKVPWRKSVLK